MAEIKSLLDGVIEQEIQNVEALSSGTDEKSKAIQNQIGRASCRERVSS